jgi:hypothetical protein
MTLDLSDEETRAIRLLQEILAKCGEVGGLTPEERDPGRRPRQGRRTR